MSTTVVYFLHPVATITFTRKTQITICSARSNIKPYKKAKEVITHDTN